MNFNFIDQTVENLTKEDLLMWLRDFYSHLVDQGIYDGFDTETQQELTILAKMADEL